MQFFLVLEQQVTRLAEMLKEAYRKKGIETICLSSRQAVKEFRLAFHMNGELKAELNWGERRFSSAEIVGVYCTIDVFDFSLWSDFSEEDAKYASQESQALWLALLTSLQCGVINPPSPDALGGAIYSPTEFFFKARGFGLSIPTILCLESGEAALPLGDENIALSVCDLGEAFAMERPFDSSKLRADPINNHQIRIREYASGPYVNICLAGMIPFCSTVRFDAPAMEFPITEVPLKVMNGLKALHKELNYALAEYVFVVQNEDWILNDVTRAPTPQTMETQGAGLVDAIIFYLSSLGTNL